MVCFSLTRSRWSLEHTENFFWSDSLVCLRLITSGGPAIKRQKDESDQPSVPHGTYGLVQIKLNGENDIESPRVRDANLSEFPSQEFR
jgi:hypothetical protein